MVKNSEFIIAGVDEVGRGPLAGPVYAAAVILPSQHHIVGITDSKKLSPKKRALLAEQIKNEALSWALGAASVAEIDKFNIREASLLAMSRAIKKLSIKPDLIKIDGNALPKLPGYNLEAIIKGDLTVEVIGAASIIAKVARDTLMDHYALRYPQYGFEQHKGYGTANHLAALRKYGPSPIHRRSFAPISELVKDANLS